MALSKEDQFPQGVQFSYVPIDLKDLTLLNPLACGRPIQLKVDEVLLKIDGKGLVLVGAPGAFTPTCTENHIPPILENLNKLVDRNIGAVIIITSNDAFVTNAWGKLLINDVKLDAKDVPKLPLIYFASDDDVKFSKQYAKSVADDKRTGRFAFVIGADKKVKYAGIEEATGLSISGLDSILEAKF